ncbi:MAG: hypothetical protein ORN58_05695 [Sediminibacterium sp.]|nr:hypothetical protein [Sediminibacterium sp.]
MANNKLVNFALKDKYINPFTEYSKDEYHQYIDSLKYYLDLKNTIESSKKEENYLLQKLLKMPKLV